MSLPVWIAYWVCTFAIRASRSTSISGISHFVGRRVAVRLRHVSKPRNYCNRRKLDLGPITRYVKQISDLVSRMRAMADDVLDQNKKSVRCSRTNSSPNGQLMNTFAFAVVAGVG